MEIKYRGYSNSLQDWVYGEYRRVGKDIPAIYSYEDDQRYIVKHGSLGQFLGFKDEYGQDVYEGDIINLNSTNELMKGIYRLVRQNFEVMAVNVEKPYIRYSLNAITNYYFKKISNVYENKEFAEKKTSGEKSNESTGLAVR